MSEQTFMQTTQPADWKAAFQAEAKQEGLSLSEWVGVCCLHRLGSVARESLSDRTRGRPKRRVAGVSVAALGELLGKVGS